MCFFWQNSCKTAKNFVSLQLKTNAVESTSSTKEKEQRNTFNLLKSFYD